MCFSLKLWGYLHHTLGGGACRRCGSILIPESLDKCDACDAYDACDACDACNECDACDA